jgi:8-oxo-dGTP pyrophosphatase MutT (NUDIX family)
VERKNGPWTIQDSSPKYRNPFIEVVEDRVTRPDGQPGRYATVAMKPGVAILPVDDAGAAYLTRQFRYAIGRESIEVACGGVDEGEGPREAARREAREELGIEASDWLDLGRIDLDTSIVRCPVHLFLARGLSFTEARREGTETMEVLKVPFAEAVRMVADGTITHGPSCVLILKQSHRRDRAQESGANPPG